MKMRKIKSLDYKNNPLTSVLRNIHKPPEKLFYMGELPSERPPCVAIVGTRKPTDYGKAVTIQLAKDLSKAGVYVISGLAFGVDSIVHEAVLNANGKTIAVIPTSLDNIYPSSHRNLAKKIIEQGGAVISEQELNSTVMKHHFLQRNRLISGLADAVIVTEATERSGTLSTVAHALEQGKEVFAVPGNITSLNSVAPNQLLKSGAHVVTSAEDILNVLYPHLVNKPKIPVAMTTEEALILKVLEGGPLDSDEIISRTKLEPSDFMQAMTMLEISGVVKSMGGGLWKTKT